MKVFVGLDERGAILKAQLWLLHNAVGGGQDGFPKGDDGQIAKTLRKLVFLPKSRHIIEVFADRSVLNK